MGHPPGCNGLQKGHFECHGLWKEHLGCNGPWKEHVGPRDVIQGKEASDSDLVTDLITGLAGREQCSRSQQHYQQLAAALLAA